MKKLEPRFENNENKVAEGVFVVGVFALILGVIAGVVMGGYAGIQYEWSVTFTWWVFAGIMATFIIGFSEIIKILDGIKHKSYVEVEIEDSSDEEAEL